MQTELRDQRTSRDDFIFLTARITRLLIEHTMSFLPYSNITVSTPTDWSYDGLLIDQNVYFILIY